MSLKILFVIDGLGSGGAERSLAQMLPYLDRANIKSTVAFFYRRDDSLEGSLRAHGADLRHLSQKGVVRRVAALRRLIMAEEPDVIHTTLFESDVMGRLAALGMNKVVVSSLVNTSYDPIRLQNQDINATKLWAARFIDSWTARHLTTCFHAITEAVKTAAVDTQGLEPQRITVIERGRDGGAGKPSDGDAPGAREVRAEGIRRGDRQRGPSRVPEGTAVSSGCDGGCGEASSTCRAAPRRTSQAASRRRSKRFGSESA